LRAAEPNLATIRIAMPVTQKLADYFKTAARAWTSLICVTATVASKT
jgi:hypothetical protein